VVGLGNPGPRYRATRHNIGFEIVSAFGRRHRFGPCTAEPGGLVARGRVAGLRVATLRPQSGMNVSGLGVAATLAACPRVDPARHLLVVYDDLDLPSGRIRLRARGGAGGQRGMASVLSAVRSEAVPRLRFGIGRPPPGRSARDHVLEPFGCAELDALAGQVATALDAVDCFLTDGIGPAMDRFNAAPEPGPGR
jgi:PTH1 family peptidyl-tRNA hydrolase